MLITLQFCSPGYISTIYLRISALCSILHYIVYCIPLAWKDQQKKQHLRNMKPISRHPRHEAAAHDHKGCLRMEKHVGPEQLEALCSPLLLGKNQRKAGQTGDYYSWDAYYCKENVGKGQEGVQDAKGHNRWAYTCVTRQLQNEKDLRTSYGSSDATLMQKHHQSAYQEATTDVSMWQHVSFSDSDLWNPLEAIRIKKGPAQVCRFCCTQAGTGLYQMRGISDGVGQEIQIQGRRDGKLTEKNEE